MRAHLRAVAAALKPLGYPVHLLHANPPAETDDPNVVPPVPYLVLRGAWGIPAEESVCGETEALDTSVLITGTASTAEGAGVVLDRVRALLSPRSSWSAPGATAASPDSSSGRSASTSSRTPPAPSWSLVTTTTTAVSRLPSAARMAA